MDPVAREREYKKLKKLINKATKLCKGEKWEKAVELFEEAGTLANFIGDKDISDECGKQMEECMLHIQDKMDEEEKKIEDTYSKLYD